jgi:hypothetical protein
MQLRRHGVQLLALLMTLTATEAWSVAEIRCPQALSSLDLLHSRILVNPSPAVSSHPPLTPQDNAACLGKRALLELVTTGNAAMLGFIDPREAASATIGEGFEVYQVDLLDLIDYDPATHDSATGLLKKMESLIYPLLTVREGDGVEPQPRSALVVSLRKDKSTWTPTNWGLAKLARDTFKYREIERQKGAAFVRVVWIPALNLHFLGNTPRNEKEDLLLIPLADRIAYGLKKGVPISAKIVFALYALEAKSVDRESPG